MQRRHDQTPAGLCWPECISSTVQRAAVGILGQRSGTQQNKEPVRDGPAKPKRAQPRRAICLARPRQHLAWHAERPQRGDRRQVPIQPVEDTCSSLDEAVSSTNRRSCALTATRPARSGPATSDDSPAAAAAASRWPRFDLRDVHSASSLARARDAAPTCADAVSNSRRHYFACFLQHLDRVAERRPRAVRL